MSDIPSAWFEALEVDPDDVARVGYSLADYAREHEQDAGADERDIAELRLMRAATLADAATLLVLVDGDMARRLLTESAALLERANAPDAWTLGLACRGAWQPSRSLAPQRQLDRPRDGIASLAALFFSQETERGNPHSPWELASGFDHNRSEGWSATGVPARLLADFAHRAREHDFPGTLDALDRIVRRADETIRLVQHHDSYHWRRFVADIPLLDPELLALAAVTARVDDRLVDEVRDRPLSPARVALLAGIGDGDPRRPHLD